MRHPSAAAAAALALALVLVLALGACSLQDTTAPPLKLSGTFVLTLVNGSAIPRTVTDPAGDFDIVADTLRVTAEGGWSEVRVVRLVSTGATSSRLDSGVYHVNPDESLSLASGGSGQGYLADQYSAAFLHLFQGRYDFYFEGRP